MALVFLLLAGGGVWATPRCVAAEAAEVAATPRPADSAITQPLTASTDSGQTARERAEAYVSLCEQRMQADATREWLTRRANALEQEIGSLQADDSLLDTLQSLPDELEDRILKLFADGAADLAAALQPAKIDSGALREQRNRLTEVRERIYECRTRMTTDAAGATEPPTGSGYFGLVVLAGICWGTFVVAVVLATRRWWRRKSIPLWLPAAVGVLGVVLLSYAMFAMLGNSTREPAAPSVRVDPSVKEMTRLKQDLLTATQRLAQTQAAFDELQTQWREILATKLPPDERLVRHWATISENLRHQYVDARMRELIGGQLESDGELSQELHGQLAERERISRNRSSGQRPLKLLASAGIFVVTLLLWGGLVGMWWWECRRRLQICAKCHCHGPFTTRNLAAQAGQRSSRKVIELECGAHWNDKDPCRFRIAKMYQYAEKICFPVLGNASTGKTVWMSMAFDQLFNSQIGYDEQLAFEFVRTNTSERIENLTLPVLRAGDRDIGATDAGRLYDPLVIRAQDRDSISRSSALVTVFDYSGEDFQGTRLENPLRQRMLHADGLIFLLDVTRDPSLQLTSLRKFLQDANLSSTHSPAAVCVSKIDELRNPQKNPGIAEQFLRELRTGEPARGGPPGIATIEARSQITRDFVRNYWGDQNFDAMLRQQFAGGFRYFPISSFGYTREGQPPDPRYIVEPFLWLLHVRGYCVFP